MENGSGRAEHPLLSLVWVESGHLPGRLGPLPISREIGNGMPVYIIESRLPRLFMGAYDKRITEGYIGVSVTADEDKMDSAEGVLRQAGAEDVTRGWEN